MKHCVNKRFRKKKSLPLKKKSSASSKNEEIYDQTYKHAKRVTKIFKLKEVTQHPDKL